MYLMLLLYRSYSLGVVYENKPCQLTLSGYEISFRVVSTSVGHAGITYTR